MNNRNYNVFFNLHTVSGIVISVGLYVIFFAGAFTLFERSIHHWEKNDPLTEHNPSRPLDYDRVMVSLKKAGYDLYGRNVYLSLEGDKQQTLYLSGSQDKKATEAAKKDVQLSIDTETYQVAKTPEAYSFSRLLYDLHFYYQLGDWGYYMSGVVALFFLFATVTGVVVHWKKIVSNFYIFRPKEKLKTVWTDAHTALGTIGIPFQFMYALTGAMFGLGILAALAGSVLYGGSTQKVYDELYGAHADSLGPRTNTAAYSLNAYFKQASTRWAGVTPKYVSMQHCESSTMQFAVSGNLSSRVKFLNNSEVVYSVVSGKVMHEHDPYNVPYAEGVTTALFALHFANIGDFGTLGNYLLRFLYFVLAAATGFVIITGVLIWLEARNKKAIPEEERRYNETVGHIYLAICLSMLPITALGFLVAKLLPESVVDQRETIFNWVFFGGWLLLSIFFSWKRDNYFTNKQTLRWGGVLGLAVPVVNGLCTGNWFWRTLALPRYDVFIIDALWLFLSLVCFYAVSRLKQPGAQNPELVHRSAKPVQTV